MIQSQLYPELRQEITELSNNIKEIQKKREQTNFKKKKESLEELYQNSPQFQKYTVKKIMENI